MGVHHKTVYIQTPTEYNLPPDLARFHNDPTPDLNTNIFNNNIIEEAATANHQRIGV